MVASVVPSIFETWTWVIPSLTSAWANDDLIAGSAFQTTVSQGKAMSKTSYSSKGVNINNVKLMIRVSNLSLSHSLIFDFKRHDYRLEAVFRKYINQNSKSP
jgi:hypothetical protein